MGSVMVTLLVLVPSMWTATPQSTKERLADIMKAQQEAKERHLKEWDVEEEEKAEDDFNSETHRNTKEALGLARDNPQDPAAVDSLRFIIQAERETPPSNASEQALEILARDHACDPGMGKFCRQVFPFYHLPITEALIRTVLEQNPNREDRGLACHALAAYLRKQAGMVRWLRERPPEIMRKFQQSRGKDAMTRFLRKDPEVLEKTAEKLLERTVSEYGAVEYGHRTLGEVAEGELFEIRHLIIGKVAPEIQGKDVDGRQFKLSDYWGKVVILTFSGNWCVPCRVMYPHERELVERLRNKPFALLSVNTDEDKETLREAIEAGEITWRCWRDGGIEGPITRNFPFA